MAILVTGAAGFIGAHLCRALVKSGEDVVGLDNLNDYYDPALKRDRLNWIAAAAADRFTFIRGDLAETAAVNEQLESIEIVSIAHLGAQAGVHYSIDNPAAYVASNLVGHANVLELARQRGVEHLVYASSSSIYGGNTKLPFSEADRADRPLSLYAATKRADELLSESYAHLYRLPQTGLRFFTVYGPWGRPDMAVWRFTKDILAGRPIALHGDGKISRDFTYIDDVIAGIMAVMAAPPADDGLQKPGGSIGPHAIYNIGNNQPASLERLISVVERCCGKVAQCDMRPMQAGDVRATFADIEEIRARFGCAPRTSLEEGVEHFVNWYRTYYQC